MAPKQTVESRLAKLEKMLGYGLFGAEGDTAYVVEQLERQTRSLAALQHEKNVGNVLGGMIRTEIAPGLVSIGPYRQDLDTTYPVEFDLWVSRHILRIKEMTIRLVPKPARTSSAVAASSGDLTSNSGGSSTAAATGTVINVESAGHVHIWLSKVSSTPMLTGTVVSGAVTSPTGTPSATQSAAPSGHNHVETGGTTNLEGQAAITPAHGTHTHVITLAANQTVAVQGNYTKWGTFDSTGASAATSAFDMIQHSSAPNDMYTAISGGAPTSVPTAAHTHTTPNHQHTTPGHGHAMTLSLAESGGAAGLRLFIGGVDRTVALGGPWSAEVELVFTTGMMQAVGILNARLEPVSGAHRIKVTSTAVGAVEITGDLYAVIRAVT